MTEPLVLVVEDDHGLREVVARGLREDSFVVRTAADGATALRSADADVDAVVLDIGLPDADGRDVCQAMRAAGVAAPVVFLTAHDGINDRLSGFSAGGDDYLGKPFHIAELAARLRAVLHRTGRGPEPAPPVLRLDPVSHALHPVNGAQVPLTPIEFRLLACLMSAPGAVRRRSLIRTGWPDGSHVSDNTLDQYLLRLRRKLHRTGSPHAIDTVRGVGYRFT